MDVATIIKEHGRAHCSGCGACHAVCPAQCITMRADSEGFLYPVVDKTVCIDCGLCEKVCPGLHPYEEHPPLRAFAALHKDEAIRMASSSGGIFYMLAERTIEAGGVVFGARFDDEWQVTLDYAETMEGVKKFMGSKYVQARTGTAYRDAECFLRQGRKVLFTGTPCQMAGLHHYLRREYDYLTTVDIVCHGVPSPKVWRRYLDETVTAAQRIGDVRFRDKCDGWRRFHFVLSYGKEEQRAKICSWHQENPYMRAFLLNISLRPSCHACHAKGGRSQSDLTIADFWGIERVLPEMDDDKGTSLLLIHTDKGAAALDMAKMTWRECRAEVVTKYNSAFLTNATPHSKRELFFSQMEGAESVIDIINACLRLPLSKRIWEQIVKCKKQTEKKLKNIIGGGKTKPVVLDGNIAEAFPAGVDTIIAVNFRVKDYSWRKYRMEITLGNTETEKHLL